MANILENVTSLFKKLNPSTWRKTHVRDLPQTNSLPKSSVAKPLSADQLRAMPQSELKAFIQKQSERSLVRQLQSMSDLELQLSIIKELRDPSILKRIVRSEVDKRLKKAAEKQLSETSVHADYLSLSNIRELSEQILKQIETPKWPAIRELLEKTQDLKAVDPRLGVDSDQVKLYMRLQLKLRALVDTYENHLVQMKEICETLASNQTLSQANVKQLSQQFEQLRKKISLTSQSELPDNLNDKLNEQYAQALEEQQRIQQSRVPVSVRQVGERSVPHPIESRDSATEIDQAALKAKKQAEVKKHQAERLAELKECETRLSVLAENPLHPKASVELRAIQDTVAALRRWRSEYPELLATVETKYREVSIQRTQKIQESQWDTWARTDLATRILADLKARVEKLEPDLSDPTQPVLDATFVAAHGLGNVLMDCAREMKDLGRLEREKDHQIWDEFKKLCDRGWPICERLRAVLLTQLIEVVSPQVVNPADLSAEALQLTQAKLKFHVSAFEENTAIAIKLINHHFREIGGRRTQATAESEMVFTRIFELYFRGLNLHVRSIQQHESYEVETRNALLNEYRIAADGRSTLVSRLKVAAGLENRWNTDSLPVELANELQKEFDVIKERLSSQLAEETQKQVKQLHELQAQVDAIVLQLGQAEAVSVTLARKTVQFVDDEVVKVQTYMNTLTRNKPGPVFEAARDAAFLVIKNCLELLDKRNHEQLNQRASLFAEAERLAISEDWSTGTQRLAEIETVFKKFGSTAESDGRTYELLFENIHSFFMSRMSKKDVSVDVQASRKARLDALYALESLVRLSTPQPSKALTAIPVIEGSPVKESGKLLEFGLKYRQILSLDPKNAIKKETQKIMSLWTEMASPDSEYLPVFWKCYLDRVQFLLGGA